MSCIYKHIERKQKMFSRLRLFCPSVLICLSLNSSPIFAENILNKLYLCEALLQLDDDVITTVGHMVAPECMSPHLISSWLVEKWYNNKCYYWWYLMSKK